LVIAEEIPNLVDGRAVPAASGQSIEKLRPTDETLLCRAARSGAADVAIAVAAAIFYGLAPRPVLVDTERVSRGPLRVTVEEEGRTRVIDRYLISAPVAGFARRLDSHVGDAVKVRCHPLRDGSRGCLLGFVKKDGDVKDWDGNRLPIPADF